MDCIKRIYDCARAGIIEYAHNHEACVKEDYEEYVIFAKMVHGLNEIHQMMERETPSVSKHTESAWSSALAIADMKWIAFLRLKDEVQDAHMDIEAANVAKANGKASIATDMYAMAKTRTTNAEKLNALYASLPYTHGTAAEQAEWDKEYAAVIAHHKKNVAALA